MLRFIVVIAVFIVISQTSHAQHVWTQSVETQPSAERGAPGPPSESIKPEIENSVFAGGVVPKWIWGPNNAQNYVLRTSVELSDVKSARLKASCDNVGTVFINGKRVASSSEWQEPMDVDVTASIVPGKNLIEAEVANEGGIAAFVLKLAALKNNGRTIEVVTDETWRVAEKRGDESTQTSHCERPTAKGRGVLCLTMPLSPVGCQPERSNCCQDFKLKNYSPFQKRNWAHGFVSRSTTKAACWPAIRATRGFIGSRCHL